MWTALQAVPYMNSESYFRVFCKGLSKFLPFNMNWHSLFGDFPETSLAFQCCYFFNNTFLQKARNLRLRSKAKYSPVLSVLQVFFDKNLTFFLAAALCFLFTFTFESIFSLVQRKNSKKDRHTAVFWGFRTFFQTLHSASWRGGYNRSAKT